METRKLSELKVNSLNPRGAVVEDDSLRELAESINAHGVLQPILVTPDGTIVAGHRRAKACELIGAAEIPIIVHDLDETEQIQIMLVENLQRADLTALQTAKAYKMLVDKGLSVRQISKAIGYRAESISRHLNVLELPEELHLFFDGTCQFPLGGIKHILELKTNDQLTVVKEAVMKHWLISEIIQAVNAITNKTKRRVPESYVKDGMAQWRKMLVVLEDMDLELDEYKEFRPVQTLLRQVITEMIETIQRKKAA